MPKDFILKRSPSGALIPTDAIGEEYLKSLPIGRDVGVTITLARNYQFHQKVFALLGYLYEIMPRAKAEYKGQELEQSFETFRRQMVALSGHYEPAVRLDGTIRIEPQSLSYSKCSEELAQQIYSDLINKALDMLGDDQTREGLDEIVNELMRFD